MAKRRSTPKLMNDLLSGKKDDEKASRPTPMVTSPAPETNTSLPESQNDSIPEVEAPSSRMQSVKASSSARKTHIPSLPVNAPEEEKVKVTFYVSQNIQYELDYARLQLLRLAPRNINKRQVSKSAIVEAALKIAIANLEQQGENSALAQMLY